MPSGRGERNQKLHVHIKNNRAGDLVFRTTPERYAAAEKRHADVTPYIETCIDWDLDNFYPSMAHANVLMTWDLPTERIREWAPNLKWIHIIGAGVEHLAPFDWLPRGVTLTNNAGIHIEKTAEFVGMALQMLNHHLPDFFTDQRKGYWNPIYSTPISGKTVAVIGVGKMGAASAKRAKQMGLRVLGIRRNGRSARYVDQMYRPDQLKLVLPEADFIIFNTPLTPETAGWIGRKEIKMMKPGAGLINLGRGAVIDHQALAEALTSRLLGGAILDVTDPEPLPLDSYLWHVPNLIITPHISSDDNASYAPLTLDLLFRNLRRFHAGKSLVNRVNPKLGY